MATINMKPGNVVRMEQLQHAITKNGFTPKQANVVVIGTLILSNGRPSVRVTGSGETFALVTENQQTQVRDWVNLTGKNVTIEGVIPETPKGKVPDMVRF